MSSAGPLPIESSETHPARRRCRPRRRARRPPSRGKRRGAGPRAVRARRHRDRRHAARATSTVHDPRFYERACCATPRWASASRTWTAGGRPTRSTSRSRRSCARTCKQKITGQLAPAGADRQGGAAQPPGEDALGRVGRGALRHRQRPLHAHARRAHGLHLRLLEERQDAGRRRRRPSSISSAARLGLKPGHARARPRLRLGRLRELGRREVRLHGRSASRCRRTRSRSATRCGSTCDVELRLCDYRDVQRHVRPRRRRSA